MRKIWKVIGATLVCLILSMTTGCAGGIVEFTKKSSGEIVNETVETITNALENEDIETIKALFSKEALDKAENIDEEIKAAIEFFDGSVQKYVPAYREHKTNHHGIKMIEYTAYYKIETDKDTYEMSFHMFGQNDENPDLEGVITIEIVPYQKKMQEDFEWQAYWGDGDAGVYIQE